MNDKLRIINPEGLELAIKCIEEDLKEYNTEERKLVLAHVIARIQLKEAQLKQKDLAAGMMTKENLINLSKRLMGGKDTDDDNLSEL